MSNDIEFAKGMIVKAPRDGAPEYVKAKISIKREECIAWLQSLDGDWVNLDVKESQGGKWYAAVDGWKPGNKPAQRSARDESKRDTGKPSLDPNDDIPFSPRGKRSHWD